MTAGDRGQPREDDTYCLILNLNAKRGGNMALEIKQFILTKNPCYKANKKITVKGLMLHSIGTPQPNAEVLLDSWNTSEKNVCVHAFIDGNTGAITQTLPWEHRAWHCGGTGNNTHIGVEMCEPSTIRYTGNGAEWVELADGKNTREVVLRTYSAAVQLFAYLCEEFSLDPLKDGVIISHAEGRKRGIASNHGDIEHIWDKLGLTMDGFREDVAKTMQGESFFTDIKGHWAEKDIIYLAEKGIVNGYGDNTFRPSQNITRAEVAKMIASLLKSIENK